MGTDPKRPFAGNPLLTRADVVTAAHSLVTPLFGSLLPSGARVDLPRVGSQSDDVVGLEALARVLWALVPLAACGSGAEHWPRVRDGITAGTDPAHTDYWGAARAGDQRLVEMAAIGVALRYAPELIWDALTGVQRDRLAAWLAGIDACELYPNNWLFFRVLVDLGRARVGLPYDVAALAFALDGIDARACDNGWYDDSPPDSAPVHDWYTPFAYHVYGLLGARTARYRERAASFARQLSAWFAPDGSALAYGRSTTYRFAQAAFWGMLAAADVDALPWGEVRGLYLRNLRAWAAVPVADDRGRLTVGYGYPHSAFGESYISAGSPYWSAKAFLALLAPEAHPFWDAPERALPSGGVSVQARPGMVLTRDAHQVLAVTHGQPGPRYLPDRAARYARIAYSSYFGFCLDRSRGDDPDAPTAMSDSTIALVDHRGTRRVRRDPDRLEVVGDLVAGRWCPWPDVVVETVAWGRALARPGARDHQWSVARRGGVGIRGRARSGRRTRRIVAAGLRGDQVTLRRVGPARRHGGAHRVGPRRGSGGQHRPPTHRGAAPLVPPRSRASRVDQSRARHGCGRRPMGRPAAVPAGGGRARARSRRTSPSSGESRRAAVGAARPTSDPTRRTARLNAPCSGARPTVTGTRRERGRSP